MDDEDYAQELFAILTRPLDPDEPRDAYGTGADGIDRHGGFGTEVVVTSVAAVPGPYGSRLEVGFRLEVPAGEDVPAEGVFHLPLAREWREASGYGAPATYAPDVARGTERAVREHISSHGAVEPTAVPDRDVQRALLHKALGSFYDVEVVAPDRIELRRAGQVEWTVLVTPDQWEQVVRRHGRRPDWLQEHFSELLASGSRDDSYLVFWEGDLVKSVRAELPPVSGSTRNLNAARARGPIPGAGWFAYRPGTDGRA